MIQYGIAQSEVEQAAPECVLVFSGYNSAEDVTRAQEICQMINELAHIVLSAEIDEAYDSEMGRDEAFRFCSVLMAQYFTDFLTSGGFEYAGVVRHPEHWG